MCEISKYQLIYPFISWEFLIQQEYIYQNERRLSACDEI